jgi:hypothetical protein
VTIQDFGSIGEFVAAIATILTLGYLALQIRLSARASIAEAERQTLSDYTAHLANLWGDEHSTGVILRALREGLGTLSDEETMMFSARMSEMVLHYWVFKTQSERDMVNVQLETRARETTAMLLHSPGGRAWWEKTGQMGWPHLIDDFAEYEGISFDDWFRSLRGAEVAAAS